MYIGSQQVPPIDQSATIPPDNASPQLETAPDDDLPPPPPPEEQGSEV